MKGPTWKTVAVFAILGSALACRDATPSRPLLDLDIIVPDGYYGYFAMPYQGSIRTHERRTVHVPMNGWCPSIPEQREGDTGYLPRLRTIKTTSGIQIINVEEVPGGPWSPPTPSSLYCEILQTDHLNGGGPRGLYFWVGSEQDIKDDVRRANSGNPRPITCGLHRRGS